MRIMLIALAAQTSIVAAVGDRAADRAGGSDQLIGSVDVADIAGGQPDDSLAAEDICEDVELWCAPGARDADGCAFPPFTGVRL